MTGRKRRRHIVTQSEINIGPFIPSERNCTIYRIHLLTFEIMLRGVDERIITDRMQPVQDLGFPFVDEAVCRIGADVPGNESRNIKLVSKNVFWKRSIAS